MNRAAKLQFFLGKISFGNTVLYFDDYILKRMVLNNVGFISNVLIEVWETGLEHVAQPALGKFSKSLFLTEGN